MRLICIVFLSILILGLSACVLKHDPVSPTMTFKIGPAYTLDSATIDTGANVSVGFSAVRNNSNMTFLQVTKAIDTLSPVLLSSYILIDSQKTQLNKDLTFKTGVYHTDNIETYTFKISDDEGYTFQKSISFIVHPH